MWYFSITVSCTQTNTIFWWSQVCIFLSHSLCQPGWLVLYRWMINYSYSTASTLQASPCCFFFGDFKGVDGIPRGFFMQSSLVVFPSSLDILLPVKYLCPQCGLGPDKPVPEVRPNLQDPLWDIREPLYNLINHVWMCLFTSYSYSLGQ